jgi:hypothetical protein
MNTVFAGNRVGGFVTLDVAGSYPVGFLGQLGPYYNYSQEGMLQQYRYTETQVDITTGQKAAYSMPNIYNQKKGTLLPSSIETLTDSTQYTNAASQVNYANMNIASSANLALTTVDTITKACQDASYSGYLTTEASQIILDRMSTSAVVISMANTTPDVSLIDFTTLSTISTLASVIKEDSLNTIVLATQNRQNYYSNTSMLLSNAYIKSNILYTNLNLVVAFRTLVRCAGKTLADPMSNIAGKESLVTQYVPSIPLNNAITVVTRVVSSLSAFSQVISTNSTTSPAITSNVSNMSTLANTLDSAARIQDNSMYLSGAISNLVLKTVSTLQADGGTIAIPSIYPNTPSRVASDVISAYSEQTRVANDADTSAANARLVSNSLVTLANICSTTPLFFSTIYTEVAHSISVLNSMVDSVNKVTSNSSAHSAVKITLRSYNTIYGIVSQCISDEEVALQEASDAKSVLDLIVKAQSTWVSASNLSSTQMAVWSINAAKARAEEESKKARDKAYILNTTAHTLVTPARIAVQTYSANVAGALNNNAISRINRLSKNVPVDAPPAYKFFEADIQAKGFRSQNTRLDQLLYKHKLEPLRLNSLSTILATKVKVAQHVQQIRDHSAFSYKQQ